MGIPSYFKKLTKSVKGILVSAPVQAVSCLLFDFNCIVYGCLRGPKMPVYKRETEDVWEKALFEEVCTELLRIWGSAGSPRSVFIAVDGVVPMAKIRQQRMRRFKSVWMAGKELEMGLRKPGEERWDTNAITPGTAFMERLAIRLRKLADEKRWTLSAANEPGEGEHKVMAYLRSGSVDPGSVVIYGLDADLILLTALTSETYLDTERNPCFLMRESGEFGAVATQPYLFLCVKTLIHALKLTQIESLRDYIALMSLLGNDFLPHGMTLVIRNGGHDRILRILRAATRRFVNENGQINMEAFHNVFMQLAATEEADFLDAIERKQKGHTMAPRNEAERIMQPVQNLPLQWKAERCFMDGKFLASQWRETYKEHAPPEAIIEYKRGMQWIVDYYMGKEVDRSWYYPWHLPPLWSALAEAGSGAVPPSTSQTTLKPQEQLAMVLPIESWHLIRDAKLRGLPSRLPQMWPSRFGFMSLGKTMMWECEADVPILGPGRLRAVLG